MEMSKRKHIFNSVFFAVLAIPTMINGISGSITLINNQLSPQILGANVIQITVGPLTFVLAIIIHMILPLIFTIALIFHIVAFYRCDLNAKPFNTEFKINLVLVIAGIIGILIVAADYFFGEGYVGMLLGLPAVAWVIAVIVSIGVFFNGFINYKKN